MAHPTVLVEFRDEETFTEERGVILNSAYCPVRGTFMLLLSCENGSMKTIRADSLGLSSLWIDDEPAVILVGDGSDEDDEDSEGDL